MLPPFSVVILVLLGVCLLAPFGRIVRGPELPDRVVALDLMASIFVGVTAVYAIWTNNPVFLDIALIVALLNFVGTIAFGFFLERNL